MMNTIKHTEGPAEQGCRWPIRMYTLLTALSVTATLYLISNP